MFRTAAVSCYNHAIWQRGPKPLLMMGVALSLIQIDPHDTVRMRQ
jgi:hypothetical protein